MDAISVSDILRAIEGGGDLPTLAPVMRRLLALHADDGHDAKLLLELVRCDPALSVRLLRTANTPGEHSEPMTDVRAAFDKLGFQNARHLALTTAFVDDAAQAGGAADDHFRLQWLWERSLCMAAAAEAFADKAALTDVGNYHTLGLLLDIGILFLLRSFPEAYAPILDRWRSEGGYLIEIENDHLGVDHTVVGQQLARTWNLGPTIEAAIRRHCDRQSEEPVEVSLAVLQLANLASAVLFEDRHITGLERAVRFGEERLGLKRAEFIDLLQRITLVADGAAIRIALEAGPAVPYVDLLRSVNNELGRAALTYEQMVRELETAMHKAETLAKKLEDANRKLRETANYDPLTRIYNRRFFDEFLNWNFNRSRRYNTTLGCLMADIDYFKRVNDTYGHLTGDRVLQGVAATLRDNLRNTDIVARYGGEEFVVLLPETSAESVAFTAQKLNQAVRKEVFPLAEGDFSVTVSIGYIAYAPSAMPEIAAPNDLVRLADQNMYAAKFNGRDRVWPEPSAGL